MTDPIVDNGTRAIALVGIAKRFGAVGALLGARLSVRAGTVHALLGENGAGKTTLMRIAFGMVRPDAGQIVVDGQAVVWRSPADAIAAGVGMVHQHFTLVPAMTVAENVELGVQPTGRNYTEPGSHGRGPGGAHSSRFHRWLFDRRSAEERVQSISRASGLAVDPSAVVADLSIAAQQRVEILKALSRDARILILDEPTAVLAPKETEEVLGWLRAYANGGGTAILITHKLREALAVADDITVLRRGRTVFTAARAHADERSLTNAMIGDELQPNVRPSAARAPAFSSAEHSVVAVLDDVVAVDPERRERVRATLTVRAGEIIGVAGVEGSGQHALLRLLAGRLQPTGGRLSRPEQVAFIPEDRHRDALVLDFTLTENVALRGAGKRRGFMKWSSLRQRTAALMRELDVRAPSERTPARILSGGNQQRLILARELDGRPQLIVAENPTRGLDVRATLDVHERLRAARDTGAAVMVYSSDLDEILALATRVVAVHGGVAREVAAEKDLIGRAILGLPSQYA
jgi:simple sugar transport system ATP-binding protein